MHVRDPRWEDGGAAGAPNPAVVTAEPAPMKLRALIPASLLALIGCAPEKMPTVPYVDIDRFMGDWYVIAHIPAPLEGNAYNEIESYERRDDGKIQTTLTFNKGAFDGPLKTYKPVATIHNRDTNAEWRMQFVWPFKSEYLIVELDDDYSNTIIGRSKRDYAWILARTPTLPEAEYDRLVARLVELGYDLAKLRRVPQSAGG